MPPTSGRPVQGVFLAALHAAYAWGAGVAFVGSLGYFVYFYEVGLSDTTGLNARASISSIVNVALYAAFAVHHSAMARASSKRWLSRIVPPSLERATYVWVASLLFFALCFFWQPQAGVLYHAEGFAAWPFRLVQIAGVGFALASARTIDVFDLSGIRQAGRPQHEHTAAHEMSRLETGGTYRIVRHPIYLGTIALLAGTPEMTADRLLFTVLSLTYLVAGVWLEERSLREEFGEAYDDYARTVRWRLLPGVY